MHVLEAGFTSVELIILVVILGIVAAIAVPKFIDVSSDAKTAATNHVASSLTAANTLNYAARKLNLAQGEAIANCVDLSRALHGGLPTGYSITSLAAGVDETVTCTLTGPSSTSATFNATGVS